MNRGKRKREEMKGKQQDWKNAKRKKMSEREDGSLSFDLKEAKKEVRKFGIAGMIGEDKKSATIKMLIGLGAKVQCDYRLSFSKICLLPDGS